MLYTWYQMGWIVLIYSCLGWGRIALAFPELSRGLHHGAHFKRLLQKEEEQKANDEKKEEIA